MKPARTHEDVENSLHYQCDVTLKEEAYQVRKNLLSKRRPPSTVFYLPCSIGLEFLMLHARCISFLLSLTLPFACLLEFRRDLNCMHKFTYILDFNINKNEFSLSKSVMVESGSQLATAAQTNVAKQPFGARNKLSKEVMDPLPKARPFISQTMQVEDFLAKFAPQFLNGIESRCIDGQEYQFNPCQLEDIIDLLMRINGPIIPDDIGFTSPLVGDLDLAEKITDTSASNPDTIKPYHIRRLDHILATIRAGPPNEANGPLRL
jgi:hypothetical protein